MGFGSGIRNKVSVGEPAEGSFTRLCEQSMFFSICSFWNPDLLSGNRLLSRLTCFWIAASNSQPRAVWIDCQSSDQQISRIWGSVREMSVICWGKSLTVGSEFQWDVSLVYVPRYSGADIAIPLIALRLTG